MVIPKRIDSLWNQTVNLHAQVGSVTSQMHFRNFAGLYQSRLLASYCQQSLKIFSSHWYGKEAVDKVKHVAKSA